MYIKIATLPHIPVQDNSRKLKITFVNSHWANAITITILILYSAFRLERKDILTWNIILCLLANNSMNK